MSVEEALGVKPGRHAPAALAVVIDEMLVAVVILLMDVGNQKKTVIAVMSRKEVDNINRGEKQTMCVDGSSRTMTDNYERRKKPSGRVKINEKKTGKEKTKKRIKCWLRRSTWSEEVSVDKSTSWP